MDELRKGDRVIVRVYQKAAFYGVIVGESKGKDCWTIVKDGHSPSTRNAYSKTFCQPAPSEKE